MMMSGDDNTLEQLLESALGGESAGVRNRLDDLQQQGRLPERLDEDAVEKVTNTAALMLTIGQSEQVCVILEALIDRCGEDPVLLNNLAFAHLIGGRLDRAVELWERASQIAPDCPVIAGNLQRARNRIADGSR